MSITSRSLCWICSKTSKKKLEDVELQVLLDEDNSQTQKQPEGQSGISQQGVFNRQREMGKIQCTGRWVQQHELNNRQMKKRENTYDILLARYKRKSFLHSYSYGEWKVDLFWEFQVQ